MSRATEYEMLLLWCKVFLRQQAFSPYAGRDKAVAFLFPMEKLFESFVGHWLKRCVKGFEVKVQESKKHLLHDENGKSMFCLKPDIILRDDEKGENEIIIIDTKWKILDSSDSKLGISQGDLYQMWAYASKYRLESQQKSKHIHDVRKVRVVLVYPQCERTQAIQEYCQNKQWVFKASLDANTREFASIDSSAHASGISLRLAFAPLSFV